MRHPRSSRVLGLVALACLTLSLAVVAPGALAAGRADDDLEQAEAKLATCRKDLGDAREALQGAEDLRALARKRPYVLMPVGGFGIVPISVRQVSDAVILKYVTGEITRARMVVLLQNLARRAQQTVEALTESIDEAREGVQGVQRRCGTLAEERNRLRAGGGSGAGSGCTAVGTWVHSTADIGSTTWTITPGQAKESGLGNATGTAVLSGQTLRITFTAADKVTKGVYTWTLKPGCRSGSGELRFTGPPSRVGENHKSNVTKTAG